MKKMRMTKRIYIKNIIRRKKIDIIEKNKVNKGINDIILGNKNKIQKINDKNINKEDNNFKKYEQKKNRIL